MCHRTYADQSARAMALLDMCRQLSGGTARRTCQGDSAECAKYIMNACVCPRAVCARVRVVAEWADEERGEKGIRNFFAFGEGGWIGFSFIF